MTWLTFLVVVGLALMPSVSMVAAQTEALRIRSFFVNSPGELTAVVEFPPGATPKSTDFRLLFDDRQVASARETPDQRLNLMFLVDVSGSMRGAPLNDIKSALPKFLKTTRPQDQFALTLFADEDRLESSFEQPRDKFEAALEKAQPRGKQTKLYRALYNTLKQGLKDDPAIRPIIVVLTDGQDEGSDVRFDDVVAESKARLVPIYAVFRGKIDAKPFQDVLSGLGYAANGTYFPTRSENEIAIALDRIYRLETSSATVRFSYNADPTGLATQNAAIELRRSNGSVLRANLSEKMIPALRATTWPPKNWPVILLLVLLALLIAGGAIWLWRRRPEPIPEKPAEPMPPVPVEIEPANDLPSPRSRGETRIIGQYFPPPTGGRPAALLRGIAGPAAGQEYAMERELFSIGANAASDLQLAEDEYVSGEHAYLRYEQGSLFIFDKASRNGTLVNDSKVPANGMVLRPGDRVTLGLSTFSVVMPER
jgi:hypothetical protein